jgi:hypothetical protein
MNVQSLNYQGNNGTRTTDQNEKKKIISQTASTASKISLLFGIQQSAVVCST